MSQFVIGGPQRIQWVLEKLLINSIKFTASGAVSLEVSVKTCTKKSITTQFVVCEMGEGVPENQKISVFGRFRQLSGSPWGVGRGLFLVKQYLSELGREIDLI